MAKKASMDKLNGLHDMTAGYYEEVIKEALENGEQLSSGTLAAINAFLKNNDIKADIVESDPMQNMTYKLQELMKAEEA
jgi:ABC-type Zn uptake system ZnuABC Zn-binding protein ZnuA